VTLIALESAITSYRFGPFLAEAQSSQAALDLYVWNEAVAASLLPPLRAIEVAVRNAFNDCLKQLYSFYWYDDPAFLTMAATRPLKHLAPDIARELSRLKPPPGATKVHPDSLTAALSFGFWTTLLDPTFEPVLWAPSLQHAFPHYRQRTNKIIIRPRVAQRFQDIRKLRNQVSHNEHLLKRKNLVADYENVLDTLEWITPGLSDWIEHHSSFRSVYDRRLRPRHVY